MPVFSFDFGSYLLGMAAGLLLAAFLAYLTIKVMEVKYHKREQLIREGKL